MESVNLNGLNFFLDLDFGLGETVVEVDVVVCDPLAGRSLFVVIFILIGGGFGVISFTVPKTNCFSSARAVQGKEGD